MRKIFALFPIGLLALFAGVLWKQTNFLPSLTPEQNLCYKEVVTFAANNKKWGNFSLSHLNQLRIRSNQLNLDVSLDGPSGLQEAQRLLGKDVADKSKQIGLCLERSSTQYVQRESSMLLFHPQRRPWDFKSTRSGFIYSSQGINPNQSGGRLVVQSRPLQPMGNGWYFSQHLAYGPVHK